MPPSPACASLRKQIADLQHTLDMLRKKLIADEKRGDAVQVADDEAGIAIAEEELAVLEGQMIENGCYEHSGPPPAPPRLTIVLLPATLRPGEGIRSTSRVPDGPLLVE